MYIRTRQTHFLSILFHLKMLSSWTQKKQVKLHLKLRKFNLFHLNKVEISHFDVMKRPLLLKIQSPKPRKLILNMFKIFLKKSQGFCSLCSFQRLFFTRQLKKTNKHAHTKYTNFIFNLVTMGNTDLPCLNGNSFAPTALFDTACQSREQGIASKPSGTLKHHSTDTEKLQQVTLTTKRWNNLTVWHNYFSDNPIKLL